MILTLTGENSFELQRALRAAIDVFVSEYGEYGLERLDGEEADLERLREAVVGLPFLTDKKLVVLRTPSKNKQFVEKFEQIFADSAESTDVILIEPKLDKRLSYYKFLKAKTDFHEYNALDQNGLAQWLVEAAKNQSGSISLVEARYLIERVGSNQQLLANELDKLLLYNDTVTRTAIDLLTDQAPQSSIFQLLEAAFAGNIRQALNIYSEQRALKVEVPQIIAMLTWQLHILALVKTAGDQTLDQVARQAKLNPYVLRKSSTIASKLSLTKLKVLTTDLLKIDIRLKRESVDPDEVLVYYLMQLTVV
jgi:DNA polymerase-3 subunit delta